MSNCYALELEQIRTTVEWGFNIPIESLAKAIKKIEIPLIAVGSGGSLTAAHLAGLLHEDNGGFAKVTTPLGLRPLENIISKSCILLISASGKNPDIISAFKLAVTSQARQVIVICMKEHSILGNLAKNYPYVNLFEYEHPFGKDGFLATNSLIGIAILLIRAFRPQDNKDIRNTTNWEYGTSKYDLSELVNKQTLFCLYSGWGLPAAIDAESKFSEAALANIQMVDYRNFAHGRHNWLAKRGGDTGIIALETAEDNEIVDRTLQLIPQNIPIVRLQSKVYGPLGGLYLLLQVLFLVGQIANSRNIDPGRPQIPPFGRRLYNLNSPLSGRISLSLSNEKYAILRKCSATSKIVLSEELNGFWKTAYRKYKRKLKNADFGGIVIDFDGTLVDEDDRYRGIQEEITKELLRILSQGILLGIATGRGKSAREALQNALPQKFWGRVIVGYYNGADIAYLSNNNRPTAQGRMMEGIYNLKGLLAASKIINQIADIEYRPKQITITAKAPSYLSYVREYILDIISKRRPHDLQFVESSHSIDIIPQNTSKYRVVLESRAFLELEGQSNEILCLGDQGVWPGNDYELLSHPYSLSVDKVSPSPDSCWNLAPLGYKGTIATLFYLRKFHFLKENTFRLNI